MNTNACIQEETSDGDDLRNSLSYQLLVNEPITYYPFLAHAFESVSTAVFLSQLLYAWKDEVGGSLEGTSGWLNKRGSEIAKETGLSHYELSHALGTLLRHKVIIEGYDAGNAEEMESYYKVNFDRLVEVLRESNSKKNFSS
jgi:hypothetical protein